MVSLLIVAAVLPVVLFGALNRDKVLFLIGASQPTELSVWLEPSEVVTSVGVPVELTVMAEYGEPKRLVPQVVVRVSSPSGIEISPDSVSYIQAFSGRVSLGRVTAVALEKGKFEISLDALSIDTKLPDLPIVTGSANLTVR